MRKYTEELELTGRSVGLASFVDTHLAAVSARRKKTGNNHQRHRIQQQQQQREASTLVTDTTATTNGTMLTDGDQTFGGGGTLVLATAGGAGGHGTANSDEESFRTVVQTSTGTLVGQDGTDPLFMKYFKHGRDVGGTTGKCRVWGCVPGRLARVI